MKKSINTLAIITSAPHKVIDGSYYSYAPYIRQINVWTKYANKIIVIAPRDTNNDSDEMTLVYNKAIDYVEVKAFNITSISNILRTLVLSPFISYKIFKVMKSSDHIHMRCPCNMSLLGAFVQLLFPSKPKSVKYAGNWDYESKQPWAYRMQQNILKNTYLSKNIKLLVFGEWKNATANMKPFMAATYSNNERVPFSIRDYSKKLKFVFIGNFVSGKRPLLTINIIEKLRYYNIDAEIHMFGDGPLMSEATSYIEENDLSKFIFLKGNQSREVIKDCLKDTHFSILPSKSEGWPKAIAEGMFFGAIPIATKISCLPWMLDEGQRGILIEKDLNSAVKVILEYIDKDDDYLNGMAKSAMEWSQIYTLEKFDEEISKMLVK
ncbi:hypothetical protein FBALC1_05808 [Flavobacteriales bacterium ALC-1]|nr:hypothetical protein FBALC1_05808 [Flavobacteriales bacterium ALC-1]